MGTQEVWQLPVVLWAGPPKDMDLISCASTPLGPPALPTGPSLCLIHLGLATTQAQGPQTPPCSAPWAPDSLSASLSQVLSPSSSYSRAGTQAGNLSGGSRVSGKHKSDRKVSPC